MSRVVLVFLVPSVVLLVVVGLRVRDRVLRGRAADDGAQRLVPGKSVARDAVLAGDDRADRRSITAALVDLDARGLVVIRAPKSGSAPEIEIVDGARLTGLEAAIVSAYTGYTVMGIPGRGIPMAPLGTRRKRRRRLATVIWMIDGDLERAGAARKPARWPAGVIALLAVAGMVLAVLGAMLFADSVSAPHFCPPPRRARSGARARAGRPCRG